MSARRADPSSRRKLVPCKKHGLHYDPELHSGCVLCRKENPPVVPVVTPTIWRVWGPFVLVLVAMAVIVYWQTRPQTATGGGGALPTLLESRAYKNQITAFEQALFDPTTRTGDPRLESGAGALANAVREREPGRLGDEAADRVTTYAHTLPSLPIDEARTRWRSLRGELFEHAGWFRDEVVAAAPRPRVDPALLAKLASAADGASRLVTKGEAETARMSDAAASDAAAAATRWNAWANEWQLELDDLARTLPPQPAQDADLSVSLAWQALSGAIDTLRQLQPVGTGEPAPAAAARATIWQQGRDAIAEARRDIDQATDATAPGAPAATGATGAPTTG